MASIRTTRSGLALPALDHDGRVVADPLIAAATTSSSCGTSAAPPATFQHVVWIVFENHGYDSVIGSPDAPYTNLIAAQCGLATNFFAETHPSLPNYIAMTSGSTQGITDNGDPVSHPLSVPSIFSQLGPDWRSLEESMPSNCFGSNSGLTPCATTRPPTTRTSTARPGRAAHTRPQTFRRDSPS